MDGGGGAPLVASGESLDVGIGVVAREDLHCLLGAGDRFSVVVARTRLRTEGGDESVDLHSHVENLTFRGCNDVAVAHDHIVPRQRCP